MTYEEFKQLALNPPRREGATIFEVSMIEIGELPEHRRNYYPKFPVSSTRIGFGSTLSGAEELVRKAVSHITQENEAAENRYDTYRRDIYCFHIKEHPLDVFDEVWCYNYGISWRLYDSEGKLMDHTWCSSMHRDFDTDYGRFRGRSEDSIRFKAGDIVEVYDQYHKCVRLAVATQSPVSIDWCWAYRGRCLSGLFGDNKPAESDEWFYGLDFGDDQAAVIDGPGYEYHEHIPTLCIMPLRFHLSDKLRKRYEGYWKACQEQDKKSE